jgi:hypothetical protein
MMLVDQVTIMHRLQEFCNDFEGMSVLWALENTFLGYLLGKIRDFLNTHDHFHNFHIWTGLCGMDVDLPKAIWNGMEMDVDPYVDPYVDCGSTCGFRGVVSNPLWGTIIGQE